MIPQKMQGIWQKGLETDDYYMKLRNRWRWLFPWFYGELRKNPKNIEKF